MYPKRVCGTAKGAEGARDQVMASLRGSGYKLTPTGSADGHIKTLKPLPSLGKIYTWGSQYGSQYAYKYDTYRLEADSTSQAPTPTNNYQQPTNYTPQVRIITRSHQQKTPGI